MKNILLFGINFYQTLVSSFLKQVLGIRKMCRYSPTCSEYAKNAIRKNGVAKGLRMSLARILTCQPFARA